eukprot:757448-Hanusia_phi.AAC.2
MSLLDCFHALAMTIPYGNVQKFQAHAYHQVFSSLWSDTNGRFLGADGPVPVCPAGAACGGSLLPAGGGGNGPPPYAHGVAPYFKLYGTGQFDGQNSGHEFYGTVSIRNKRASSTYMCLQIFMPSTGWINNCDGGRSHTYCDYSDPIDCALQTTEGIQVNLDVTMQVGNIVDLSEELVKQRRHVVLRQVEGQIWFA